MLAAGPRHPSSSRFVARAVRRSVRLDALRRRVASDSGLLFVFRTRHARWSHYAATDRAACGASSACRPRATTDKLCSSSSRALKPGLAGAWHYQRDGHLRPDKLMAAWRSPARKPGRRDPRGLRTARPAGRWTSRPPGDHQPRGQVAADQVVVATGAWTPQLSRVLRRPDSHPAGQGLLDHDAPPGLCPRGPLIFEEHRVAITPMQSGYRIGSTMEFAGYDAVAQSGRLDLLRDRWRAYTCASRWPSRARSVVRLAADDARRAALHRPSARHSTMSTGGRALHAGRLDGAGHRQTRGRTDRRANDRTSIRSPTPSHGGCDKFRLFSSSLSHSDGRGPG